MTPLVAAIRAALAAQAKSAFAREQGQFPAAQGMEHDNGPAQAAALDRLIRPRQYDRLGPPRNLHAIPAWRGIGRRPWHEPSPAQSLGIALEHGWLSVAIDGSASAVALSTALAADYAGSGILQPGEITGHIYGAGVIAAGSYVWDVDTPPDDHAASYRYFSETVGQYETRLAAYASDADRAPSLWTGLARWLAQTWGPFRDLTATADDWAPGLMPAITPRRYGLVRDLDGSTLTYWLVYCGAGEGGYGGTGEGAVGADDVAALRLSIDPGTATWAAALVADEVDGEPLTVDARAYYEAVVIAGLARAAGAEPIILGDTSALSGGAWSCRAHGMQWAPVALGDLASVQWEARAVQWRWEGSTGVVQEHRTLSVAIGFSGSGSERVPVATVTGRAASGTVCWPWTHVGVWTPQIDGTHARTRLVRGADTWGQSVDAAGPVYGFWTDGGTWKELEYEGSESATASSQNWGDTAADGPAGTGSKQQCGSWPTYSGGKLFGGSRWLLAAFGESVEMLSGSGIQVYEASPGGTWTEYDFTADGADPSVVWYTGTGYWNNPGCGWAGSNQTPPSTASGSYYGGSFSTCHVCSGTNPVSWYTDRWFWKNTKMGLFRSRRDYGAAEYVSGGFGLVIGADDPSVHWIITARAEDTGVRTLSRSSTVGAGDVTVEGYRQYIQVGPTEYCPAYAATRTRRQYVRETFPGVTFRFLLTAAGTSQSCTCGNTNNCASFSGLVDDGVGIGTRTEAHEATIRAYRGGDLLSTETIEVPNGGDIYDSGDSVSWEHLRLRCIWRAADGEEALMLPQPGGLSSGGGGAAYQRWTGDDVQVTDGAESVSLGSRPVGVI